VAHQPRHGLRVCTNLQTNDPAVAKTLALRLAAEWLVRFSHEPEAPLDEHLLPAEIGQPPLPLVAAPPVPVAPALSRAAQAAPEASGLSPHVADMLALYRYWRGRAPSTVREFERLTRTFDKFMQKTPAQLMRTDITSYRNHLRVKTSSSRRLVPLHSDVIAAGFDRYVQNQRRSGHEWPFSDLEPDHDGRRGGNFGKFFARFLRQNQWCGITDRRLVFHSFRHTFKTLCMLTSTEN